MGGEAEALLARRFAIVQVWRPISSPLQSNPLAMADARSVAPEDLLVAERRYPHRVQLLIWDEVHESLKRESRLLPRSVDGAREGAWIIADYLDVVLHVFTPDARGFYRLEELWGDVPAVDVDAAAV